DSLGEAIEDRPSTFRPERRPGGEGAPGRADAAVDVGRAAGGDLTEHQSVDGREDRERTGAGGRRLAADPVARLDLHVPDPDARAHGSPLMSSCPSRAR